MMEKSENRSFEKCKMQNEMRFTDLGLNDTTYCRGVGLIISAATHFLVGPFDYISCLRS